MGLNKGHNWFSGLDKKVIMRLAQSNNSLKSSFIDDGKCKMNSFLDDIGMQFSDNGMKNMLDASLLSGDREKLRKDVFNTLNGDVENKKINLLASGRFSH